MKRRGFLKLFGFGAVAASVAKIPDVASAKIPDVTSEKVAELPIQLLPKVDGPELFKPEAVVKDAFVPEIWAKESLEVLEENAVVGEIVHRDFEEHLSLDNEITIGYSSFPCKHLRVTRRRGSLQVEASGFCNDDSVEHLKEALKSECYWNGDLKLKTENKTLRIEDFRWTDICLDANGQTISFNGQYKSARVTLHKLPSIQGELVDIDFIGTIATGSPRMTAYLSG